MLENAVTPPKTEGVVVACYLDFQALGTGVPVAQEWAAFKDSVETHLRPLLDSGSSTSDDVTQAGRKLLEMASCRLIKDSQKLQRMRDELTLLVKQILGES